ncbi:ABC transporter permease subunit [Clostridium sp. JN-1]|jgi:ABC-2 type transport system permease protein|uniref:ABC transporter permease subunit n=1 Tax=Clostridium sp. JN-1 TaxID=2483110 RepID=UPI000F0BAB65|nr:ABC transporter permease subunit [Clostridium sp. JN-1]
MYNLLKFEVYKLKHNKIFLSSLMITLLLIIYSIYLFFHSKVTLKILETSLQGNEFGFIVNNFKDRLHPKAIEFFYSSFGFSPCIAIILIFIVGSLVLDEFSSGTINNTIVYGHTRDEIYISKFITASLSGLILTALLLFGTIALGSFINFSREFLSFNDLIKSIEFTILAALILSSLTSIYMCLSMFIQNKLIFITLIILTIILTTSYPPCFESIIKYSPIFMLIDMSSFKPDPYSIIFSSFIIIVITIIIGILRFNKLELK